MRAWSLPLLMVCIVGCGSVPVPECPQTPLDEDTLYADVAYLASHELDGRYPGTAGDRSARRLLTDRFACLGLNTLSETGRYDQPFADAEGNQTANILGYVPGVDPTVGSEIVLISAHIDHFGGGYLGANDDASGVAAVMAIAQAIAEGEPPQRTVAFAAFGSEESGFEGSQYFVDTPPADLPVEDIVYNLNLDMIGTYAHTGIVYALGSVTGTTARTALSDITPAYPDLEVELGGWSDQSDNVSFCEIGIPYVFFWTDDPRCYHRRCDRADRVDYAGMLDITQMTLDLSAELANSSLDLLAEVQPGQDVCRP